jgi:predicted transcriptional regulator
MSLERVIRALVGLGLSRSEAEIYVYIAKKGPQTITTLTTALNFSKHQISTSLKNLINKELISKDDLSFSALPFEVALEYLIKKEKEQADNMQQSRKALLYSLKKEDK